VITPAGATRFIEKLPLFQAIIVRFASTVLPTQSSPASVAAEAPDAMSRKAVSTVAPVVAAKARIGAA
jgi:hypothetical protein